MRAPTRSRRGGPPATAGGAPSFRADRPRLPASEAEALRLPSWRGSKLRFWIIESGAAIGMTIRSAAGKHLALALMAALVLAPLAGCGGGGEGGATASTKLDAPGEIKPPKPLPEIALHNW